MVRSSRRPRVRGRGSSRTNMERGNDGVPAVFREMLEDVTEVAESVEPSPSKRRRRAGETTISLNSSRSATAAVTSDSNKRQDDTKSSEAIKEVPSLQTVVKRSDSSDESEVEWEEVELNAGEQSHDKAMNPEPDEPLSITIGGDEAPKQHQKRKARRPLSLAEKKMRLDIHKVHIVFLLFHSFSRNHWCNDAQVQGLLRHYGLIPAKLIRLLHPSLEFIQFRRSAMFNDALRQICDIWRKSFTVTASGLTRPSWLPSGADISKYRVSDDNERFLDIQDFRDNTARLRGSADFGAQLLCALLRALGVETRLVCSLQPLTFKASGPTSLSAKNHGKTTLYLADSSDEHPADSVPLRSQPSARDNVMPDKTPAVTQPIRRFGRPHAHQRSPPPDRKPKAVPSRTKPILRPRHPVFWVEVLDLAYQRWIPIDPFATGTVASPSNLEPALDDPENVMTYVIAFEEGGIATDVTRRYAKAYNAKTIKSRVDSTIGGEEWFSTLMKLFSRRTVLDRDQIEAGALAQRELAEGMPRNVQDFKGHPVYVLERHLRRNEVIHPRREVGKIGQISKSSDSTSQEAVYRRQDVHVVWSADRWFRLGRNIKLGEVPIRRVQSRRQRESSPDDNAMDLDGLPMDDVGLYAIFQTEVCIPSPIVDGKVPKNAYGNVDVYVPSMIPPGGVQICAKNARLAARILEIDYADAVTGFSFRGRQGTAILTGVVVAAEYKDAMLAVLDGLAYTETLVREQYRTTEMLGLWRKFVVGLRIVERVNTYVGDGEYLKEELAARQELDAKMEILDQEEPKEREGKLALALEDEQVIVVESTHPPPAPPRERSAPVEIQRGKRLRRIDDTDAQDGGFLLDTPEEQFSNRDENESAGGFLQDAEKDDGGFFHDQSDGGGGFMADDNPPDMIEDGNLAVDRQDEPEPELSAPIVTGITATSSEKESHGRMSRVPSTRSANGESSNDADMESLLSHDPEDDDAEPEWLD